MVIAYYGHAEANDRMAFNLGRPALFAGEETIRNCREFLKHPLAVLNDSRLVATCELLSARGESRLCAGIHVSLSPSTFCLDTQHLEHT